MINAAIEEYPDREWIHSAIEDWLPTAAFHVVFSNAALQWLAEPRRLSWRLQLLRGWSHEQHIKAVSS
jgi:trans-aconitate methyltransferase